MRRVIVRVATSKVGSIGRKSRAFVRLVGQGTDQIPVHALNLLVETCFRSGSPVIVVAFMPVILAGV